MEYHCRGNCGKSFASISSRNKHERKKEHFNEKKSNHEINFDKENKLYLCPSTSCETASKYRHNIEGFDTYTEFSEDLYLDINIYNSLLQKANSHI